MITAQTRLPEQASAAAEDTEIHFQLQGKNHPPFFSVPFGRQPETVSGRSPSPLPILIKTEVPDLKAVFSPFDSCLPVAILIKRFHLVCRYLCEATKKREEKMPRRILICVLVLSVACSSVWAGGSLLQQSQTMFEPIPQQPLALENNPLTPEKIELGKMLYFDPRLSASQLISCQTCHNVGLAGTDLQETSVGHGWQKGPRNAPTVHNAVFNLAQFWDGRAKDLAEQAKGPVQASVEMNNTPEQVLRTLNSIPGYVKRFEAAFPKAEPAVSFDNMAKAIEAFEATLITANAPFDQFLRGDNAALTAQQKLGLELFIDRGCASCHNGRNLGGQGYYPFGVVEVPTSEVRPADDLGRYQVSNLDSDKYVFRAPALRNVALTQPYFHSGKVWDLEAAVAVMGSSQLGIKLTEAESQKIAEFLESLNGEMPEVVHPILPPSSKDTPKPVLTSKVGAGGH